MKLSCISFPSLHHRSQISTRKELFTARALPFVLGDEVKEALASRRPVLAFESTIFTHGMPQPRNFSIAKELEDLARSQSVVPATTGIIDGIPTVGLTEGQIEKLASRGKSIRKCSIRDLPYLAAKKADGATTVATTMHLANLAGIRVFATGGLGGVHRDGENTMDISADLITAGRTPVLVVCAGAKSILDIPKTLEVLETQGVCVAAYKTEEFPAFFTAKSGQKAPLTVNSPEEAAELIYYSLELEINTGVIIGVPIRDEDALAEGDKIDDAIGAALKECGEMSIGGPSVTPFLLKRVRELTGGASLEANIKIVRNNTLIGCQIAKALCKLMHS